ncbi:IGF-like family receptor 1 isoform X2 [Myxocyprinus asiaticus]|uniref:IGF-like family receptor 1 isoform X2 n=1 Tax=Myxocyprinus asiaticus TaxID=70543 RepID=UPI0022216427|nr:IGF-like family receptor 1 isoform X2 [Myxocyprinus asiaticus]
MTSERCLDDSFWNHDLYKCQRCETINQIIQGFEFSPNCGLSDNGDPLARMYKKCRNGTFNDGSFVKCQRCNSCASPQLTASICTVKSDAICCREGEQVSHGRCIERPLQTTTDSGPFATTASVTDPTTSVVNPSIYNTNIISVTGIYVCAGILSTLTVVCLLLLIKRWRTRRFNEELKNCCNGAIRGKLPQKNITESVSYNLIKESSNNDHGTGSSYNLLAPEVQAAPLKTVLNNLDVLEELVLVLDPDISGAKNTRHLAAQCSFSFVWINYAYSMKDHKSPLVAVLEGVVTKNPDWTVGKLAGLLNSIDRNDAVEILAKLPVTVVN